jgi:hypothetical protein
LHGSSLKVRQIRQCGANGRFVRVRLVPVPHDHCSFSFAPPATQWNVELPLTRDVSRCPRRSATLAPRAGAGLTWFGSLHSLGYGLTMTLIVAARREGHHRAIGKPGLKPASPMANEPCDRGAARRTAPKAAATDSATVRRPDAPDPIADVAPHCMETTIKHRQWRYRGPYA